MTSVQLNVGRSIWGVEQGQFGYIEGGIPNHDHLMFNTTSGSSADARQNQLNSSTHVSSWWYSGYAAYVLARVSNEPNAGISGTVRNSELYKNNFSAVQPTSIAVRVKTRFA